MNAQLQFRNLTLGYDRHPAVHHLNGTVAEGALLAVVGPNGAGKSTLFKGIVGGGYDGCYVTLRVFTPYGVVFRTVNVCY